MHLADKKSFVKVDKYDITISDDTHRKNTDQKLSTVDLKLFELAKIYKKGGRKVVLVTNDRSLQVFAKKNGIESYNAYQYLREVRGYKTTDIKELRNDENITNFQKRKFPYGLISGVLLSIFIYILKENSQKIFDTVNIWGTIIILFVLGVIFFLFRTNFRLVYGILEIVFGFYISIRVFTEKDFNYESIGIVEVIQIIGGIYVMVRGFSNFDDRIKGTLFEPRWKTLTRFRNIGSA